MRLMVILLRINAALFFVFGIGFIFAPAVLAQFVTGAAPALPTALTDMRATYGGMALGIGIFFAYTTWVQRGVYEAVIGAVLVMLGLALGRTLGIVIDGSPNKMMHLLLAAEILFATLLIYAVFRSKKLKT